MIGGVFILAAALGTAGQPDIIVLDRRGHARPATRAEIGSASDAVFAWVWSESLPPRRLPVAQIDDAPRKTVGRLEVAIHVRADATRAGLQLVAAPLRMWQEVPELLIPRHTVPTKGPASISVWPGEPWAIRVVGLSAGSPWIVIEPGRARASLTATPARTHYLSLISLTPAENARLQVYSSTGNGTSGPRLQAVFVADQQGRVELPAWPQHTQTQLVLSADGLAPAVLDGARELPAAVRLDHGYAVAGCVRDVEGAPVGSAGVLIETWVDPHVPIVFRRTAEVDGTGSFRVRGLPPGDATVLIAAKGLSVVRRALTLRGGDLDLGVIELETAAALRIKVVDAGGEPVPRALLRGETAGALSDDKGVAILRGLNPRIPLRMAATAHGFLERTFLVASPTPEELLVVLDRGMRVRGIVVDEEGGVVTDAEVMLRRACEAVSSAPVPVVAGVFDATVLPSNPEQLALRSQSSLEVIVNIEPGSPGEERDLGTITLPRGTIVRGTVAASSDLTPLAGARIWALRGGDMGPLVAAALGNVLSATSDAEGRFRLGGLRPGPTRIHAEASGFARSSTLMTLDRPGEHDVGTIALSIGTTVRVRTRPPAGTRLALVQIESSAAGHDAGALTAAVENSEASLTQVPPGSAAVSVLADGAVVCEKTVRVPDQGELRVDCPPRVVTVRGVVRIAGKPAGGGSLLFSHGARPEVPEAIINTVSSTGLRQQQSRLAQARPIEIPVRPDATFGPRSLTPGSWETTFHPAHGGASSLSRTVQVPDATEAVLEIEIPGLAVTGMVIDTDDCAVPTARVTVTPSGATALSGSDGTFAILGLNEGRVSVQAHLRDRTSPPVEVDLAAGRRVEPLRLRLVQTESTEIAVMIEAERGHTPAGATVLLDLDGRGTRFASLDSAGRATVKVALPHPPRMRVIAFSGPSLGIGDWVSWETAVREGVRCRLPYGGGLLIDAADGGTLRIASDRGEDLTVLLRLLGVLQAAPAEGRVVVWPLPPGHFTVSVGTASRRTEVRPGEQTLVPLR